MLITVSIYSFQLSGGWRFDDAHHLLFLSQHTAFEYIYQPIAARMQSGAHYTPFNILTYDLAHRLFSFQQPAGFYGLHLLLLGTGVVAVFLYLSRLVGLTAAVTGALFFLLGFPIAGISGQLMVGHYVLGFIFSGFSLYYYDIAVCDKRISIRSLLLYFLACISKEIFVPLIAIVMIDPRVPIKNRVHSTMAYVAAAALFWTVRALIVGTFFGGYNNGLPVPLGDGLKTIFTGILDYFILTPDGIAAGTISCVVIGIAAYASLRNFGPTATLLIAVGVFGMLFAPLLPVSLQIGPKAPTEIRLLTMVWWFVAFCAAISLQFVRQRTGILSASMLALLILAALSWNTTHYLKHGELAAVERQFDSFTYYVFNKIPCNLVDTHGWSSWTHDLYGAVWPGLSHPVIAVEEIIRVIAAPGSKICRYKNNRIVEDHGKFERNIFCNFGAPLRVRLHHDGVYVDFAFGPEEHGIYYLEVPGKYFLELPVRLTGAMPNLLRFENLRILRVTKGGGVICSPLLHFLPMSEPTLVWQR